MNGTKALSSNKRISVVFNAVDFTNMLDKKCELLLKYSFKCRGIHLYALLWKSRSQEPRHVHEEAWLGTSVYKGQY